MSATDASHQQWRGGRDRNEEFLLDPEKVRRRRVELGYSNVGFRQRVAGNKNSIVSLENGGSQRYLDVATINRIAKALATSVNDLLIDEHMPDLPEDQGPLVEQLGAVLHTANEAVPYELLCDTLDCTLTQLVESLGDLEAILARAGMILHHNQQCVKIVPRFEHDAKALHVEILANLYRRDVRVDDVYFLWALAKNKTVRKARFSHPQFVRMARAAGLIEDHEGTPQLTDDVRYSLMLDEFEMYSEPRDDGQ